MSAGSADARWAQTADWLLVAACCGYLYAAHVSPSLHIDTAWHIARARACLAGGVCDSIGQGVSFGSFAHFALFSRFLRWCFAAGLSIDGVQVVCLVLLVVACVLVRRLARRVGLDPFAAMLAAGFFAVQALWVSDYPVIFNRAISYLPGALFYVALFRAAERGNVGDAIWVGAGLGLLVESYFACVLMIPIALTLLVASSRRPIPSLLAAAAAGGTFLVIDSPMALAHNLRNLLAQHLALPSILMIALAVAVGVPLRARFAAMDDRGRLRFTVVVPLATILAVIVVGSVVLDRSKDDAVGYLTSVLPLLAIATAVAVEQAARRLVGPARTRWIRPLSVGALAVLSLCSIAYYRLLMGYLAIYPRFGDVEKLATHLYDEGHSLTDLKRDLRGPYARDLLVGLEAYAPAGTVQSSASSVSSVVVLTVARSLTSAAPDGWRIISVRGGHAVIASTIEPFSDVSRFSVSACSPDGGADATRCVPLQLSPSEMERSNYWAIAALVDGPLHDGFDLVFAIPIATTANSEAHILRSGVGWRIDQVEGVSFRGDLPSRTVTIDGGRDAVGLLRLRLQEWQVRRSARRHLGRPELWEVRESDAALVQPIEFPFIEPD